MTFVVTFGFEIGDWGPDWEFGFWIGEWDLGLVVTFGFDFCLSLFVGIGDWDGGGIGVWDWYL